MTEWFTLTNNSFDDVGVRRSAVHPLPPAEMLVRLQDAIAVIKGQIKSIRERISKRVTHKVMIKPKKKPNSCAAIAGFGAIAATQSANVVRYTGNMIPIIK